MRHMILPPQLRRRQQSLKDSTIRDFGGGWNVVDNELNLSTKYASILDNMARDEDGSVGVRWGTRLFSFAVAIAPQYIVNMIYYQERLVVVLSDGTIKTVDSFGTQTVVWSDAIAGALPPTGEPPASPIGWRDTNFASFCIYNGDLIICSGHGIDKPLIVNFDDAYWGYPPWRNDTDYVGKTVDNAGTRVVDPAQPSVAYEALIDHTSAASPATFPGAGANWEQVGIAPPAVQYLYDLGTQSNGFIPPAKYCIAMNHYLVLAGDPAHVDRVYISSRDTSGTFEGADPPNDGVNVDLGKVGVQGDQEITGLNRYRDKLIVGFDGAIVFGTLGIYDGDEHTPVFDDVSEGYGCHSHRSMVNLGNDLFMLDQSGIPSIQRTLASGTIDPKRVSELIDPAIVANVTRLTRGDTLNKSFAVYNGNDKQYMLFVPNYQDGATHDLPNQPFTRSTQYPERLRVQWPAHSFLVGDTITLSGAEDYGPLPASLLNDTWQIARVIDRDLFEIDLPDGTYDDTYPDVAGGGISVVGTTHWTETYGYIYTFVNELRVRAWSRFRNWRWRAGCVSELGRVFFADDYDVYTMGSITDPVYTDFKDTAFEAAIEFAWELPWADFDKRMNEKHMRYIAFDTKGTSKFLALMFVDNIYKQEGSLVPNNVAEFIGGDSGGYGKGAQPYGGGRLTSDERLYAWTARYKLAKLRFQGQAASPLKFISISVLYQTGDYRR